MYRHPSNAIDLGRRMRPSGCSRGDHGDDAKLLAGGHSLLPLLKLRVAQPRYLIDVARIPELSGIRQAQGALVFGATTTHAEILARSPLVRTLIPILAEAAGAIGDPQIRNVGTIGGSLAHADPSADLPAVMLALDAEIIARGPLGERTIPARTFFVDLLTTALAPTEVLTRVHVPLPPRGAGGAYEKYPHPASRYAIVGVAADRSAPPELATRTHGWPQPLSIPARSVRTSSRTC